MAYAVFKICPCCNHQWQRREDFLSDLSLYLNGYQSDLDTLEEGLLLFTHEMESCHSTLGIQVKEVMDLYQGPRYPDKRALSKECPRYCLDPHNLKRCEVHCECAFVRELIQLLKQRMGVKV